MIWIEYNRSLLSILTQDELESSEIVCLILNNKS